MRFICLFFITSALFGGATQTQVVTMSIEGINQVAIPPQKPCILQPQMNAKHVLTAVTTLLYSYTTNAPSCETKRLTGNLDIPLPQGITLRITAIPPPNTQCTEQREMRAAPQDLVTNIPCPSKNSCLYLNLYCEVLPSAKPMSIVRTLTLTLID